MKKFNLNKTIISTLFALSSMATNANSVWQVTKGDESVYIGGTIHMLPESEFPLPQVFTDTYNKTDSLVLEADMPEPTDLAAQQKILQFMSYPKGETLGQYVTDDTYQKLNSYFSSIGMSFAQFEKFKPSFLATTMLTIELQKVGMAGAGVDSYFAKLAASDNKPQEYLETLEFQMELMASQGIGKEDKTMQYTLEQLPKFEQQLTDIISAWRKGNEAKLKQLLNDELIAQSPDFYDKLMTQRNKDWLVQIEQMFNDKDTEFVLVGVAHLVGDDSLLNMLEDKGYQLTKL